MDIKVKLSLAGNLQHYGKQAGDIISLALEDYVKGVVAAEISNAPLEACKAQAVAVRAFAQDYRERGEAIGDTGDTGQAFIAARMTDTTQYPNAIRGVEETASEILAFQGTPIGRNAHYSSANNGTTKTKSYKWPGSVDPPYLVTKDDPWTQAELKRRQSAKETIHYGHGVGMSQYGAMYAASQGIGYREILDFYYPSAVIAKNYGKEVEPIRTLNATEQAIVAWANKQVGSGYVWGSVGQKLTEDSLAKLIAKHGKNIQMPLVTKWMGKNVFDCAGLITAAFSNFLRMRVISGVSSQWKGSYWDIKGTIDTMPKDCVCMLYKENPTANPMQHGGIYCADDTVVDARGSNSGVLKSKFDSYPWSHWAISKGMLSATEIAAIKNEPIVNTGTGTESEGGNMATNSTAKVIGSALALRTDMSTNKEPIIRIAMGTVIFIVEKTNATWWKVKYGIDTGYVMAKYVTELNIAPVNPSANDNGDAGQDEVEDNQFAIHLLCKSQAEADAVLKLLKTAVTG